MPNLQDIVNNSNSRSYNLQDIVRSANAAPSSYYRTGSGYNPTEFLRNKYALDSAMQNIDGLTSSRNRTPFSVNGGTDSLYNTWRKANTLDALAIEAEKGSEWWNQLQAQIAGALGGEHARKDWTFDASKFDITNGIDASDLEQGRNFIASLPGMMVGGILEGAGDLYEGLTGRPINEYRNGSGGYEIPEYTLDASQRAADLLDAGINLAGTFTGGAGRVIGGFGKTAAKGVLRAQGHMDDITRAYLRGEKTLAETKAAAEAAKVDISKGLADIEKAKHRQDLIDGMSKGIVTRAVSHGGHDELGTFAGLLADAGDEAVEEFVQSYAEDVRNKNIDEGSFERALTGAAWGAAGGLFMGAGGRIMSGLSDIKTKADTERENEAKTNKLGLDAFTGLWKVDKNGKFYFNDDLREAIDTDNKEHRRAPAAGVFKMSGTNWDIDVDEAVLGIWNVRSIFEYDERSAQEMAEAFGTDIDTLRNILRGDNAAEELTNLVASSEKGKLKICVGRNPDTKNGGFYLDVSRFVDGAAFEAHPLVANVVGADWDGDTCSVYFNTNRLQSDLPENQRGNVLQPAGYFHEILYDPEGHSNIEWIWGGISDNTDLDLKEISKICKEELSFLDGVVSVKVDNTDLDPSEALPLLLSDAFDLGDKDERNNAISESFHRVGVAIKEASKAGVLTADQQNMASMAMRNIVNRMFRDSTAIINRQLETQANVYITGMLNLLQIDPSDNQADTDERLSQVRDELISDWSRGGTTMGLTKAYQMTQSLGMLTFLADPSSKYNPIYRQYGGLRYSVNSVPALSEMTQTLGVLFKPTEVVNTLLLSAFRLSAPGKDPTVAIESMCDILALSETYSELGIGQKKIQSDQDLDAFKKKFIEKSSKYSRIYNEAERIATQYGYRKDPNKPVRKPIDGKEHKPGADYEIEFDGAITADMEKTFFRQFNRIFEEHSIDELFSSVLSDVLPEGYSGAMSWGDFCMRLGTSKTENRLDLILMPIAENYPGLVSFIKEGVRQYGSESKAIGKQFVDAISSSDFNFENMLKRWEANNRHFAPEDIPMLMDYLDVVYRYAGYDECIAIGLIANDELPGTDFGKMLFSKNPKERINAIVSASLYGQLIRPINAYFSDDTEMRINAEEDLDAMRAISPLHNEIISNILENDSLDTFIWFCSLNNSLDEKIKGYDLLSGFLFKGESFITNCLQSEVGQFAISSVSAKNKRAEQARKKMARDSHDLYEAEVNGFVKNFEITHDGGRVGATSDLEGWFYERGMQQVLELRTDIIAMKAISSLTVNNDYIEKATIPEIYALLYNMAELDLNGGMISALDSLTCMHSGHLTKSAFVNNSKLMLACACDPSFSCWVWDPDQGKNVYMSQDTLFASCGQTIENGKPNAVNIMALFKKYPKLATHFCQGTTSLTIEGNQLSAQRARVAGSLQDDFNNWCEERMVTQETFRKNGGNYDQDLAYELKNALFHIKSQFANSSKAHKVLTAMVDADNPGIFEGFLDSGKITKAFEAAADKLARYVIYRRATEGDQDSDRTRTQTRILSENRVVELQRELFDEIYDYLDTVALNQTLSMQDFSQAAFFQALSKNAIAAEIARDSGIDVAGADLSGLDSVSEKAIGEINKLIAEITPIVMRLISGKKELLDTRFSDLVLSYSDTSDLKRDLVERLRARKVSELVESGLTDKEAADEVAKGESAGEPGYKFEEDAGALINNAKSNISAFDGIGFDFDFGMHIFGIPDKKHFVDKPDFLGKSDEAIKATLIEVLGDWEYGWDEKKLDNTIADIKDENGEIDEDKVEKLICDINSRCMQHHIRTICSVTGRPINSNAEGFSQQLEKDLNDVVDEITIQSACDPRHRNVFSQSADDYKVAFDQDGLPWGEIPEFRYVSQTLQSMISNQTSADPAAGNGLKVGTFGSAQKWTFLTDHIPASVDDLKYAYTRQYTKKEIEDNIAKFNNVMALGEDGETPVVMGSTSFMGYLESLADDAPVIVFDPECNPHGLPTFNMRRDHGLVAVDKEYHRLSSILNQIVSFNMEAMVMKTKKKMREVSDIVDLRILASAAKGAITTDSYGVLRQHFMDYRNAFAASMRYEFDLGDMQELQFHDGQDIILAQALTPGMVLDVVFEDGSSGTVMADASLFFDQMNSLGEDRFNEFLKKSNIKEVKKAQIATLTVGELGSRIMDGLSNEYEGNSEIDTARAESITLDYLSDWSDYAYAYDGDVSALMYSAPALGTASNISPKGIDNEVPRQKAVGLITGSAFGNVAPKTAGEALSILVPKTPEFRKAVHIGRVLGLNAINEQEFTDPDIGIQVTKVFASARVQEEGSRDFEKYRLCKDLENLTASDKKYRRTWCFCQDLSRFQEAKDWAIETSGIIAMPESEFNKLPTLLQPGVKKLSVKNRMKGQFGGKTGTDIVFLDYSDYKRRRSYMSKIPASKARPETLDSITLTVILDSEMAMPASIEKLRAGDSSVKLFKRGRDRYTRVPVDHYEVKLSRLFPQQTIREKRFLSPDDAVKLLDILSTESNGRRVPADEQTFIDNGFVFGDHTTKDQGVKNTRYAREEIVSYLLDLSRSKNRAKDDVQPDNIKSHGVAAIVTDGDKLAPVFYPELPYRPYKPIIEMIGDGNVTIHYGGETPLFVEGIHGSTKENTGGETAKGTDIAAPKGIEASLLLTNRGGRGHTELGIHRAMMSETEGSRVGGFETQMLSDTLVKVRALTNSSLFYKVNDDGVLGFSDSIRSWPLYYQEILASGRATYDNLWDLVISGELPLHPDKKQNDIICKALRELKRNNRLDPIKFFSNYRLSGKIVVDENGTQSIKFNRFPIYFAKVPGRADGGYINTDHRNILQNFEYSELLLLFNAVDETVCKKDMADNRDRNAYIVSDQNTVLVHYSDENNPENDVVVEAKVRFGEPQILGDYTYDKKPGGTAAVSAQHIGARASMIGYSDATFQKGLMDNFITSGHYGTAIEAYNQRKINSYGIERTAPKYSSYVKRLTASDTVLAATRGDVREAKRIRETMDRTFGFGKRKIVRVDDDGNYVYITSLNDLEEGSSLKRVINELRDEQDYGVEWTLDMWNEAAKCAAGACWTAGGEVDANGNWIVYDTQVAEALGEILKGIKSKKRLPITIDTVDTSDINNRYPMPGMTKEIATWFWRSFPALREGRTFDSFHSALKEEQGKAEENIKSISWNSKGGPSKYKALVRMANGMALTWGDTSNLYLASGNVAFPQLETDYRSIFATFAAGENWSDEQRAAFMGLVEMTNEKYENLRKHLADLGYMKVTVDGEHGSKTYSYNRVQEAKDIANILNNLAETSKVMAVLNPFLTAGNLADRMFHQGSGRFNLWLGKHGIGPYTTKKEHIVPAELLDMAVNGESAVALYESYREMEFDSTELLMVQKMVDENNDGKIMDYVKKRKEEKLKTVMGKVHEYSYKAASGGMIGIKTQMKTVVDRFVQFVEEDPVQSAFWLAPCASGTMVPDGSRVMTVLEEMISQPGGFSNLMSFCLSKNSPSYSAFMQAMNFAKAGDIAQKNAVAAVLLEIIRHVPFGNFIMTTCISRFPTYGLNVTGRVLNYVLPISSMYKAFTEFMSKTEMGQRLGLEEMNVHRSMKEAMMVDMCKLGAGTVALILFSMSGALQPPEDERKWGNSDEWILFGKRAGESWWVQDILGISLPLACFWKACEQGKPRFDILFNGIAEVCYSNPMVRCSDLAAWLLNPAESLVSDYNEEVAQFANARGGAPSLSQYIQSNAFSTGMNWLTQFCTPSIIRDWWRSSYSLEKSYKRDWERSASGQITEAGRNGKTEYVTYDEAIKRKLAQRNPVLAFLFSIGNKSYMPSDMPDTVYYDDYQLDSTLSTSVIGLEGAEREAKVTQLLSIIMSYEDMQELADDGFHLDYETMRAVADQVWDNYHAVDEWYDTLQAEGALNYYTLGNGDWNEGQKIAAELKQERDNMKQYWYNFYYRKLKNSPISQQIQLYNRYNTSYAMDVYGEAYATGMLRSPFNTLPFVSAPGTMDNPEGTAGYENDFNSISAVTGRPLSQRALIPKEAENIELPDFEELSSKQDGKTYSQSYYDRTGTTPTSGTGSGKTSSSNYGGSGRSGSGGGGGGGRGGYGGSYAPNAYAPSVSLPKSNASRIMNRDRLQRPQYDYLRPDFETKGSREAYKRSDI